MAILLLILGIVFWTRRRRNGGQESALSVKSDGADDSEWSILPEKPRITTVCSVREIDGGSLSGSPRELPDNGRFELLDETSPSGSGNEIRELSPLVFVAHELRTHRSSKESQTIQNPTASIVKSTKISRKSWPAPETPDGTPCIETVISASTRRSSSEIDVSSPASSLPAEVSPIHDRNPRNASNHTTIIDGEPSPISNPRSFNLDRSLPPTPISESPQLSPRSFGLSRVISLRKSSHLSNTSTPASRSPPFSPNIPASKYSEAFNRSKRPRMGRSLRGLETAIPPSQPDSEGSGISALSSEEPVVNTTWL